MLNVEAAVCKHMHSLQDCSHDFAHVQRVRDSALKVVSQIPRKVVLLVIELAALCHDIGDTKYEHSTTAAHLLLECGPKGKQSCVWVSAREEPIVYLNQRPFVLREQSNPLENIRIYSGINGERLEQVEERMKQDIVNEARQLNGLLLVHNEFPGEHTSTFMNDPSLDKKIMPCLLSVDDIKTSREIFEGYSKDLGFRIRYHRVPVTRMQTPTDAYIDEYVRIFRETPVDVPVVFSCGLGVGRSTHAYYDDGITCIVLSYTWDGHWDADQEGTDRSATTGHRCL